MKNNVKSFVPSQDMPISYRERQEKHFCHGYKAICFVDGKLVELVDARIGATDSCVYSSVWLETKFTNPDFDYENGDARGSAKAGGYGYHRASASLESAFARAGMHFENAFGGCGWDAIREAIQSAGEYLAPENTNVYLVECYG